MLRQLERWYDIWSLYRKCGEKQMAGTVSKNDEGTFLMLYNRGGYVLDFSTNEFDVFTTNSIGVALCDTYRMSKGKSLVAYLNKASDEDRTKLLSDLFSYYEENMEYEFNENYIDDSWWGSSGSRYNERYAKLYEKCKAIMDGLNGVSAIVESTAEDLIGKFSSQYMTQQIKLMVSMQKTNPTEAIGKAKELIESCCKTILDEMGIPWSKNDDVSQLSGKVLKKLDLLPDNVQPSDPGTDSIKAVLGNLRAIPSKLAELRNPYGSGHGKSASYVGLEERHAKLAVGCSITFVDFVWSTYESMKRDKSTSFLYGAKVRVVPNEAGGNTLIIE